MPRLWLMVTDNNGKETNRQECWPNRILTNRELMAVWEATLETNFKSVSPADFLVEGEAP